MTFLWQFIGVIFATAGAVLALTISMIVLYIVVIAIQSAIEEHSKQKSKTAKKRRIDLFERREPDVIVCLIVRTDHKSGVSERRGLLKVRYYTEVGGENALRGRNTGPKRSFVLR